MKSHAWMRIAYVIDAAEDDSVGAPTSSIVQFLQDRGAQVEVFALRRRDGSGPPPLERTDVTAHLRQGGERDHLAALLWLEAAMTTYRPDVIWTSSDRAMLLGQLVGARRRLPVVSWRHALDLSPAKLPLLRANQRLSALWVGDTQSVTALTAQRLKVPAERLAAWPLFAIDPQAPLAQAWRPGQRLRIGSLGQLHPLKGYDVLIQALAVMKSQGSRPLCPIQITIAGQGREQAALQSRIQTLGLTDIVLCGHVDRPQVFLAEQHLYVQPSRSEGLCVAAHQAMLAGLPVIASSVGELPYSIAHETTGLVVPPACPTALASALHRLLSAPQALAGMGQAGRERLFGRFGPEAFQRNGARVLARLDFRLGKTRRPGHRHAPDRR